MKLLLTTILMLVCLVAYAATPSYSNFSSNQFAPSATYTVTVKNQPKLTNIIEHAQLSLTNPAFANSLIYITNMTGTNGLTNAMVFVGQYGPRTQFAWMTNGVGTTNVIMVISNGLVGIGKAPLRSLDVAGGGAFGSSVDISGNITVNGNVSAGAFANSLMGFFYNNQTTNFATFALMRTKTNIIEIGDSTLGLSGAALSFDSMFQNPIQCETATNTVVYSQGTNLVITDGIQANSTFGQFNQFTFSTSGTPVMVISNGMVGIGKANPTTPLDVVGSINTSGGMSAAATVSGLTFAPPGSANLLSVNAGRSDFPASGLNFNGSSDGKTRMTIGYDGTLMICAVATQSVTNDNATNTVIISDGNALKITDSLIINSNVFPITANFGNMKPCGCVTWMSNFTCYMICTNSADGNATTNKLGGL